MNEYSFNDYGDEKKEGYIWKMRKGMLDRT